MSQLSLPAHGWKPRPYQRPAWDAFAYNGIRRLALCWHRRAGKDDLALHMAAYASQERVGGIWHMLPEASQARKAVWDAVNPHTGRRRIDDAFPLALRDSTRESDMFIRFKTGSTWQVVGSDNFNSLVGSPPIMVVFSEYALADPNAWAYLRPILVENDGLAVFISSSRGRNHFSKLVEFARGDPHWFAQVLTVDDTGAIPKDKIDQEFRELAAERGEVEARAIIDQEYYCSFDAALPGAIYGELMTRAEREGRIAPLPYRPGIPVGVATDLGIRDSTAMWFYQEIDGRVRLINYLEGSGVGLEWYAKRILALPYAIADFLLPHDGGNQQLNQTGDSISQQLTKLGIKNRVIPRDDDLMPAINATRNFIAGCEFSTDVVPMLDETLDQARERMQRGLSTLRMYRRRWNANANRFDDTPYHDWASNGADAFRTLARGHKTLTPHRPWGKPKSAERYAIT